MKRFLLILALAALLLLPLVTQCTAAQLFSDGFESYTANGSALDKNYAGPNAAANGSGNPWFGPAPPNACVVGSENGINPHTGLKMIKGANSGDQNWLNIAYRYNANKAFTGGVYLDAWFYDPLGAGSSACADYMSLANYGAVPSGTDYPGTGSLNGGAVNQRVVIGCCSKATGASNNVYQVRILGANEGLGNGYFNTTAARTVGWHEMKIVAAPALADGTCNLSFYVDNMINPILTHNSVTKCGFNVIEINTMFGSKSAYYDDVAFGTVPEPGSVAALMVGLVSLVGLRRRRS